MTKKVLNCAALLALPILLLSGCGPSDAPSDWKTHEGDGFTIAAPDTFEPTTKTSSNGESMLVLQRDSKTAGAPFLIAVVRDANPNAPAKEQIKALEMLEHAKARKAHGGWLIEFDHDFYNSKVNVPTHSEQLMVQASDDLIVNVIIMAPKDEFNDALVDQVLDGFDLER
jgi:hypothetical protein